MPDDFPHHIAIEGNIGVGKSSLCRLLADHLDASLILEDAGDNPFLSDFYRNRKQYAFSTQIFFLMSRYRQQHQLLERDLFIKRIISDYVFDKDNLFASVNLSPRELVLYQKLASVLKHDVAPPDLAIYLQASTAVIMGRIKKRNRPYEKGIGQDYIESLNEAYNSYFFHYSEAPLLVVKTDEIDFVSNPDHLDDLIEEIRKPRGGITYYSPAGNLDKQIL